MTRESTRLRRLRREADNLGLVLRKLPERDRWYAQYGPYMVVDAHTNGIVVGSIADLDAVETTLAKLAPQSEQWRREQFENLSPEGRADVEKRRALIEKQLRDATTRPDES